jgi:hypothetical protein
MSASAIAVLRETPAQQWISSGSVPVSSAKAKTART